MDWIDGCYGSLEINVVVHFLNQYNASIFGYWCLLKNMCFSFLLHSWPCHAAASDSESSWGGCCLVTTAWQHSQLSDRHVFNVTNFCQVLLTSLLLSIVIGSWSRSRNQVIAICSDLLSLGTTLTNWKGIQIFRSWMLSSLVMESWNLHQGRSGRLGHHLQTKYNICPTCFKLVDSEKSTHCQNK